MADNEKKALDLMEQAKKKQETSKGLFSFFRGNTALEDAADLYVKAANSYKMARNWTMAGKCFCESALIKTNVQCPHEAATNYVEAGNCYKKCDPNEAVGCLQKAIDIYTDMGRFTMAAKNHITIAEIYESDVIDINQAIRNYEQAADYYKGEESNSSANKCLLKVAQYAAHLEQYEKAIDIYEQVASASVDNTLLKYGVKDHFFRAALCHMCIEVGNASIKIQSYEEMFPSFSDSRECKLIKGLIDCVEETNVEGFTDAVREYDSISRLDQWYTTMLLRIKKTIEGEVDLK